MSHHKLKLLEQFADVVYSGEKPFEIRENDRGFQKGDTVEFDVRDKAGLMVTHPLGRERFEITYVLSGWGLKDGWVVFGIRKIERSITTFGREWTKEDPK